MNTFNRFYEIYHVRAWLSYKRKLIWRFLWCRTYSASKYPPIDFAALWGILHDRKYAHFSANGIHFPAIHCFTKESYRGDNYFILSIILASQRKKTGDSQPLAIQKQATPSQSWVPSVFVIQSCLADVDFMFFRMLRSLTDDGCAWGTIGLPP